MKKHYKKNKRKLFLIITSLALVIFWFCVGCFLLFGVKNESIYVFPKNPKQGDTVFIRVKSFSEKVEGSLRGEGSEEKLTFFKKGDREWVSFLGIDATQKPGEYKIFVNAKNKLTESIKVSLADFSLGEVVKAPDLSESGFSNNVALSNIRKNDNPILNKAMVSLTLRPYFANAFSYPLSKIETGGFSFGKFISFTKYKIQHLGVDLRASKDTNILAINDGKVVLTANLSNYGKTIIVDHGFNIFSLYLHLDEFKVTEGEMVKRGQRIGLSGDTGYATAPHLHFSMRVGNSRIDPIEFIKASKKMDDNFILADISAAALSLFKK